MKEGRLTCKFGFLDTLVITGLRLPILLYLQQTSNIRKGMSLGNLKRKYLSISEYTCVGKANSTYQAAPIENYFHFLRCFSASPLLLFHPSIQFPLSAGYSGYKRHSFTRNISRR